MSKLFAAALAASLAVVSTSSALASDDHDHSLALFLGAKSAHSHTDFASGLDYEYRPMPIIGVTAFVEKVPSAAETSLGAGLAVHPIPLLGLRLHAIPGVEMANGHNHFLMRFGAGYEVGLGPVFAGPTVNLDLVDGNKAWVYGIVAGIGF